MIDASTPTNSATPPAKDPAASKQKSGLTSDFNTFLKMLTAQARNQDPLEPLNSSEYAAQLAQFSMVEQQVKTNEALQTLIGRFGSSDMSALSGWIGKDARTISPSQYDGTPIEISTSPVTGADRAQLVVRDSQGAIIDRKTIAPSARDLTWPDSNGAGGAIAHGIYSFSVESYRGDELLKDSSAATYNRVVEARIEDGKTILVLDGGQTILSSVVTAVRAGSQD